MGAVFISFSGNCKKALTFYQSCFGGTLQFHPLKEEELFHNEIVVCGSLLADSITIYGSDLVHNEGRKTGNFIAIYVGCKNSNDRMQLIEKLLVAEIKQLKKNYDDQNLIELTDSFDVRWVFGIQEPFVIVGCPLYNSAQLPQK